MTRKNYSDKPIAFYHAPTKNVKHAARILYNENWKILWNEEKKHSQNF